MLGPVFGWELVRSTRRRWHWWARALYIGSLLLLLYLVYDAYHRRTLYTHELHSHRVMAQLGSDFYRGFSLCQLLAVLALSPIYAATSIAEEKSRQTLPFLLSSQLRDGEIVFSKIGLAMLRVTEVLLCGLPLCAICLLLGGVRPVAMLLDFLVALTACGACCALGVLTAIVSRRLVEGLFLVCMLQVIWYMLPVVDMLLRVAGSRWGIPRLLLDMNAFRAMNQGQSTSAFWQEIYTACLIGTTLCWLTCSLAAWWILRPAWRREQEQGGQVRSLVGWLFPPRKTQTVWDRPCLWRELRSRRWSAVDRIVWALYCAAAVGVLSSIVYNWQDSVQQIRASRQGAGMAPVSLIVAAYAMFLCLQFLSLPYVAISGASAFSEEREENHWELLRVTHLEQRELVRAKIARLLRQSAWILIHVPVLALSVLALGWGTLIGFTLTTLHCASAGLFWVMLGLAIGLRANKTSQAIVITLSLYLMMTVALPFLGVLIAANEAWYALIGSPMHCLFLQVVDNALGQSQMPQGMTLDDFRLLSIGYTALHLVAAAALYRWTLVPAGPWRTGRGEVAAAGMAAVSPIGPAHQPVA